MTSRQTQCTVCKRIGHYPSRCKRNPVSANYDPGWSIVCKVCKKIGHGEAKCRRNPASEYYNENWAVICERCHFSGHFAYECRSKYTSKGEPLMDDEAYTSPELKQPSSNSSGVDERPTKEYLASIVQIMSNAIAQL